MTPSATLARPAQMTRWQVSLPLSRLRALHWPQSSQIDVHSCTPFAPALKLSLAILQYMFSHNSHLWHLLDCRNLSRRMTMLTVPCSECSMCWDIWLTLRAFPGRKLVSVAAALQPGSLSWDGYSNYNSLVKLHSNLNIFVIFANENHLRMCAVSNNGIGSCIYWYIILSLLTH